MARSKRQPGTIHLPEADWEAWTEQASLEEEDLQPGMRLRECHIALHSADALDEVHFFRSCFSHIDFTKMLMQDVIFENCELVGAVFDDASFFRVHFIGCRLSAVRFSRARLRDVAFSDCLLDYASFGECAMKDVLFDGGRMREGSMQHAALDRVYWRDLSIDGTDLTDTRLRNLDLSSADFGDIRISPELAGGLIIRPEQAPAIIRAFGVKLKQ